MDRENEGEGVPLDENRIIDWTMLTEDVVVQIFLRLNHRDRASLSSTCKIWRHIGSLSFMWQSIDLRAYKFDAMTAHSLSSRGQHLRRLTFNGANIPHPIMNLNANKLKEMIGYNCKYITDDTLSMVVAGHQCLQTLQLGPELSENITSRSIITIANHCPKLQKLKLSGINDINEVAINALATSCKNLVEIGFTDCLNINEIALGNVSSLRFLSVAGTINMRWVSVSNSWTKLPNLVGLDVSRTNVNKKCASMLLSSASGLRVLCALECPLLPIAATFSTVIKGAKKIFRDCYDLDLWRPSSSEKMELKNDQKFRGWRSFFVDDDKVIGTVMDWLECVVSHFLLRDYQSNPEIDRDFWYDLVPVQLFSLLKSPQVEVAEMAMNTLSQIVIDQESSTIFHEAIAFMVPPIGDEEIGVLLNYSISHQEGLQLQAIEAIANLSTDSYFWKSVERQKGRAVFLDLAKSKSPLVVEAAAKGLYNLSLGYKTQLTCFDDAGGIKALVDLLSKWPANKYVLKYAAGAVANLASHKTYAAQILSVGGLTAVLTHALNYPFPQVREKALGAVAKLCLHEDSELDCPGIRKSSHVLDKLVQLTHSIPYGVRVNAVAALYNLCCYEGHNEAMEAARVIETFVDLAQPGSPPAFQQKAASFLWEFSAVKENSIVVGERGGIAALIALTESDVPDVRDIAARALCHLAFLPCNALRIKEEKGVTALVKFCKSTQSKAAHLYSAVALACMHDERMVEYEKTNGSKSETMEIGLFADKKLASDHIRDFILTVCDSTIFNFRAAFSPTSSILQKQAKELYIEDAFFISSLWVMERLISLLSDSSSDIKACAAFALLQYTTPCNVDRIKNVKLVQEAGGQKMLRALAASKISPDPIKILAKIVLFCVEQNEIELKSKNC